jgi:hypothetical protein
LRELLAFPNSPFCDSCAFLRPITFVSSDAFVLGARTPPSAQRAHHFSLHI